jgi:hypothetical protein
LSKPVGALVVLLLGLAGGPSAAAPEPVALELVLTADVSRSIDEREFRLQRGGYAQAISHPAVLEAIRAVPGGRIAVMFAEWAGAEAQKTVVPWATISDAASAGAFARALETAPRSYWGWTSISGAIDHAVRQFGTAYVGRRRVIDVSGDGVNNSGRPAAEARDDAVARGITINGLVILNDAPPREFQMPLDEFFRANVIGGPGAFVVAIDDFESFAFALVNKLVREIAGLPPSGGLGFAAAE